MTTVPRANPTRRRQIACRANPVGGPPWLLIGGLAAIGVGIFIYTRRAQAAAPLPAPAPLPLPSRTAPAPSGASNLSSFLAGNRTARQIFNVQALAYEYGLTDAHPDGKFGPITQRIINTAEGAINVPRTTGFNPGTLISVRRAGQMTASPTLRLLPVQLTANVISQLNADARSVDPSAVLVQARA